MSSTIISWQVRDLRSGREQLAEELQAVQKSTKVTKVGRNATSYHTFSWQEGWVMHECWWGWAKAVQKSTKAFRSQPMPP